MFEIIDKENKIITILLHLEEIYMCMKLKQHIKEQARLFSKDRLSKSCVDVLVAREYDVENIDDYRIIVDFSHIKHIMENSWEKFWQWLSSFSSVTVCHCEKFDFYNQIRESKIAEENALDYRNAFKKYGKKYIKEKCVNPKGLTTQIGVKLSVYIDIKKIINDSVEMLRWCYIIANGIDGYFQSIDETGKRNVFFCHTMNGAYIAGILSQLLGYDLVYVDHLGPYNKLNKVDFNKGKSHQEEFIIVADMICQGNEFLRAKNIVEYLGGTVRGCVGVLRMDISSLIPKPGIDIFAIKYAPIDAVDELGYSIQTKLCPEICKNCIKEK